MSALFTNYFGIQNAKNFEDNLTTLVNNLYLTVGKNTNWSGGTDVPTTPTNSSNTFYNYWGSIVAFKKVTASDINLVVPRVDWISGNNYIAYHHDLDMFKKTTTDQIHFDYQFYVRNSKDQVFKCLANNITSNTQGAISTVEPEITIGGQLPEDPYIQLSDGYKWKYMYTIPSGLKERFFSKQYMPVLTDSLVDSTAVDGRLDVFKIKVKGDQYNSNTTAYSLPISTVTGNGTGANVTLGVTKTLTPGGANVTEVNVITAGSGYTYAGISITDPTRTSSTANNAVIEAIIGPPGGHGSDVAAELGASNLMICPTIDGDEAGVFPLSASETHPIRQIGLILNPLLLNTNSYADDLRYRGTDLYYISNFSNSFTEGHRIYQGSDPNDPTFSAIVEHFDNSGILYATDIRGTPSTLTQIKGASFNSSTGLYEQASQETGFISSIEVCKLKRYSGKLLYIENTTKIDRSKDQTIQFKFILRF